MEYYDPMEKNCPWCGRSAGQRPSCSTGNCGQPSHSPGVPGRTPYGPGAGQCASGRQDCGQGGRPRGGYSSGPDSRSDYRRGDEHRPGYGMGEQRAMYGNERDWRQNGGFRDNRSGYGDGRRSGSDSGYGGRSGYGSDMGYPRDTRGQMNGRGYRAQEDDSYYETIPVNTAYGSTAGNPMAGSGQEDSMGQPSENWMSPETPMRQPSANRMPAENSTDQPSVNRMNEEGSIGMPSNNWTPPEGSMGQPSGNRMNQEGSIGMPSNNWTPPEGSMGQSSDNRTSPGGMMGMPDNGLPSNYQDEYENERDWEHFKNLYPEVAKAIMEYVEEECDRLEYEGSILFDEYPDKTMLSRITARIYDQVKDTFNPPEGEDKDEMLAMNTETRRRYPPRKNWLGDMIDSLFFNEMFRRRCRRRNCRRY